MAEVQRATFSSAVGEVSLARRPATLDRTLLAWDAADELLLDAFAEWESSWLSRTRGERVLVVGDTFGALAVMLRRHRPSMRVSAWSDSFVSELAIRANADRNDVDPSSIEYLASTESIDTSAFDLVLWRIPSANSSLAFQVRALAPVLRGATVIAGGLDKYTPPSARVMLASLGDCVMRRGRKKAHLFDVRVEASVLRADDAERVGGDLVFGDGGIDVGTRVMLGAFDQLPDARRVCDLGCGTGVLGVEAWEALDRVPHVTFVDESHLAVEAARDAATNAGCRDAAFVVDDSLTHYNGEPFDLVVCNPPFHDSRQRGVTSDEVAWTMMRHARYHLSPGGQMWVVGNRHLGYHAKLQRLFGNCAIVTSHPKFVVLSASR